MATILLTGHSRGLGAAMTQQLLTAGHRVIGFSRSPITSLGPALTERLHEIPINLADPLEIEGALNPGVLADLLRDQSQMILINNAGLLSPIGFAGSLSTAEILQSFTANTAAAIALTNAFIKASQDCDDRRILQISSGAARSPYAGWSVYCATKAALDHFSRAVNAEQHPRLRIESLAPGIIDTDMQAQVRATSVETFPMRPKFDQLKASGALAKPADAARAIIDHLFSDAFGKEVCTDIRQL